MSKNSICDYLAVKLFGFLGAIFLLIPPEIYVRLGKIFGRVMFYLDKKHRDISYRNIRFVFSGSKTPAELRKLALESFENLGMNIFEAVALARVDKAYINKYVEIEGLKIAGEELAKKKGLIFVTLHLGNWEIANAACGLTYNSCNVVVKEQKHSRLNDLLNSARKKFGINLIGTDEVKDIIRVLEGNQILTVVSDHGAGKNDLLVNFFGRPAAMPAGAARLALKFKTPIIFAYITRKSGPYHKIRLARFSAFKDTGDKENDLRDNLEAINRELESYILRHPGQYLWSYKRWKHSPERSVLILSDGKAGHLRQSQAIGKIMEGLGISLRVETAEVKFKNRLQRLFLYLCLYFCPSSEKFLRLKNILGADFYDKISGKFYDVVISCGASLAALNLIISRENKAKALHILRAGLCPLGRFDLVIIPRHDQLPKRKNVAVTEGALNLIDEQYLKDQAEKLRELSAIPALPVGRRYPLSANCIGLLVGGDTKNFKIDREAIRVVIGRIKEANLDLLVTTSRRTPRDIENLVKAEFKEYPKCKLLVIANENNIPQAVGGILALSSVAVVTAESISMISEAASSAKYTVVIKPDRIDKRHARFLDNLSAERYIYLSDADRVGAKINDLLETRPEIRTLNDRAILSAKLKEVL